ncbi:uncharacterized protein LOC115885872 [Sitophilus oryzae]|uniref:Uncharacterized protein LOC115885872 n=1 Tax=Sitophilus oryzae TaxID=7048 RepID=A0A6J2YBC5_SITOR|nr:uncharacterized protein LOC115885872 [Sitophilus oryzae]
MSRRFLGEPPRGAPPIGHLYAMRSEVERVRRERNLRTQSIREMVSQFNKSPLPLPLVSIPPTDVLPKIIILSNIQVRPPNLPTAQPPTQATDSSTPSSPVPSTSKQSQINLADQIEATPGTWNLELREAIRALRPPTASPVRRYRMWLTTSKGRRIRVTIPADYEKSPPQ